jgi:enoyl-CoA hydratase
MRGPLHVEISGGVATLTLNRPSRRNALSSEILNSLRSALGRLVADGARALVLTGAGHCFSAGADISELQGTAEDIRFDDSLSEIAGIIHESSFLAIAAIEGPCLGAAFDLACACDVRVISPTAFFELPAVRLGLLYNPTAIARIQRMLPAATVRRLLLLGDRIGGSGALAAGIATHLAEDGRATALANEIACRVVASPRALIESKRLLNALEKGASDLTAWHTIRKELLASPERRVALAAAKSRLHP